MSLDCFIDILSGLGMFLFGMKLLSDSLEAFAGNEVENRLKKATNTPFKGILLGAGITGIIQSSTATTMMTAGLVSAGMLNINEALPVIMGANIGTTVTGQLLKMSNILNNNPVFSLFKPSAFSAFFVLSGAVEKLFFKKDAHKHCADIFIGLGILFIGMDMMENSVKPLSRSESFRNIFTVFENPLLSVLVGTVATVALQSSSVAIGILQSLTVTGAISVSAAVPVILGINLGKALPEFIITLGTNKNTIRTIFADLMVNGFGVVIAFILFLCVNSASGKRFDDMTATHNIVADFHTIFNILTTSALLPFYKRFIRVSEKVIH